MEKAEYIGEALAEISEFKEFVAKHSCIEAVCDKGLPVLFEHFEKSIVENDGKSLIRASEIFRTLSELYECILNLDITDDTALKLGIADKLHTLSALYDGALSHLTGGK